MVNLLAFHGAVGDFNSGLCVALVISGGLGTACHLPPLPPSREFFGRALELDTCLHGRRRPTLALLHLERVESRSLKLQ